MSVGVAEQHYVRGDIMADVALVVGADVSRLESWIYGIERCPETDHALRHGGPLFDLPFIQEIRSDTYVREPRARHEQHVRLRSRHGCAVGTFLQFIGTFVADVLGSFLRDHSELWRLWLVIARAHWAERIQRERLHLCDRLAFGIHQYDPRLVFGHTGRIPH